MLSSASPASSSQKLSNSLDLYLRLMQDWEIPERCPQGRPRVKTQKPGKTRRCKAWWLSPGMFHIFQRVWGCKASRKKPRQLRADALQCQVLPFGVFTSFCVFFSFFAIFLDIFHGCSSWAHLVILRSVAGFSKPTSPPSVSSSIPISKLGRTFRASPWTQLGQI